MIALRRVLNIALLLALLFAFWLMLDLTLPYITGVGDRDFLRTKLFVYHILHWRYSFYIHVGSSMFVLVAGLFQFNRYIINKQKMLHRVSGYVYVIVVLFISGPASFIMGLYANGGVPARTSFVLLSTLWLFTTAMAWRQAVRKRFTDHGAWMLRSYALTLSAISLRTYNFLLGLTDLQLDPVERYILIAWLSWIPNLVVAEVMIRRGFIKSVLKGRAASAA